MFICCKLTSERAGFVSSKEKRGKLKTFLKIVFNKEKKDISDQVY